MGMASTYVNQIMYHLAPGPRVAEAFFDHSHGNPDECHLDAAAMRSRYKLNKTPVTKAVRLVRACSDPSVLERIVTRERRVAVVKAAIGNPNTPLQALLAASVRVRENGWQIRGEFINRELYRAIGAHTETYGVAATCSVVMDEEFQDPYSLRPRLLAEIPGVGHDLDVVTSIMENSPASLHPLLTRGVDSCSVEVVRHCATHASLATTICSKSEYLERDPLLGGMIFDWHCGEMEGFADFQLCSLLADAAIGAERLEVMWDRASIPVRVIAGMNPQLATSAVLATAMFGAEGQRARLVVRCLQERVGDEPQAYVLAAELLEDFGGTFGELCELVVATLV